MKNKISVVGALCFSLLLLSSCTASTDRESSSSMEESPAPSVPTLTVESSSVAQSPKTSVKRPLPDSVAQGELPEVDENGKPYIDTSISYKFEDVVLQNPWDAYKLFDTVIKLTQEDLTGAERFIADQIYCFIDAEGLPASAARLPVGDKLAPTAQLYLSATDAVLTLKEGDVIALAGIPMWKLGAIQKIYKIHPQIGNVCHFTTIASRPDEFLER